MPIGLSGLICKDLKRQEKLPEKWNDMILDTKITFPIDTIPIMTSNTTPEGKCWSSSSYNSSRQAWGAFTGKTSTSAQSSSDQPLTVTYTYARVQDPGVYKVRFYSRSYAENAPRTMTISLQTEAGAWKQIYYKSGMPATALKKYESGEITVSYKFKAIKFAATQQSSSAEVGICNCQLTRLS